MVSSMQHRFPINYRISISKTVIGRKIEQNSGSSWTCCNLFVITLPRRHGFPLLLKYLILMVKLVCLVLARFFCVLVTWYEILSCGGSDNFFYKSRHIQISSVFPGLFSLLMQLFCICGCWHELWQGSLRAHRVLDLFRWTWKVIFTMQNEVFILVLYVILIII